MPTIKINTDGNNSFDTAQVGDLFYATNFWNINLSLNAGARGEWTVPAGANIRGDCYASPTVGSVDDTGQSTFCYTIPPQVDHGENSRGERIVDPPTGETSHVHAYPFILLGSLGGRRETWGTICRTTPTLADAGRCGRSAVYDMRVPNANVKLPVRVDNIGSLKVCFDVNKNHSGDPQNIENVFIDTYLHRIDKPALWPDGYQGAWGDLNKINENATETWNLNFKLCLPEGFNATQATGGALINGNSPIVIDNREWGIFVKWETAGGDGGAANRDINSGLPANGKCNNSFFYVSFVPWSATIGVDAGYCNVTNFCINYDKFIDYISTAEFKDRILGTNQYSPVAARGKTNYPRWIWEQVGQPPFLVDARDIYVLDGVGLGNELWFSPNAAQSCIRWSHVYFEIDGQKFGNPGPVTNPKCKTARCTAIVSENFT